MTLPLSDSFWYIFNIRYIPERVTEWQSNVSTYLVGKRLVIRYIPERVTEWQSHVSTYLVGKRLVKATDFRLPLYIINLIFLK
jgi:hypothetical protein